MVEVTAIMDDPESLAKMEADHVAREVFISDMQALLERHGVILTGGDCDNWPGFRGSFGDDVELTEWYQDW